jgi:hypothetical protein
MTRYNLVTWRIPLAKTQLIEDNSDGEWVRFDDAKIEQETAIGEVLQEIYVALGLPGEQRCNADTKRLILSHIQQLRSRTWILETDCGQFVMRPLIFQMADDPEKDAK